jgi:hypothetical protein
MSTYSTGTSLLSSHIGGIKKVISSRRYPRSNYASSLKKRRYREVIRSNNKYMGEGGEASAGLFWSDP